MKLSFTTKIAASFALISFCTVGGGFASLWFVGHLCDRLDEVGRVGQKKLELLSEVRAAIGMMRFGNRGILLYASVQSTADAQAARRIYRDSRDSIHKDVRELRTLVKDHSAQLAEQIDADTTEYDAAVQEVEALTARGALPEAIRYNADRTGPVGKRLLAAVDGMQAEVVQANKRMVDDAAALRVIAIRSVWILLLFCLLVAVAVGLGLRKTMGRIATTARDVRSTAAGITSAAQQLLSSSQTVAEGASQQAAAIQETSVATGEIAAATRRNAETADLASGLMRSGEKIGVESQEQLNAMEASVRNMNQSSGEVLRVVKVIDGIAFQTNILALNAAVEAARAGEAGLSFAVVADEVRTLAQRSAEAAKETAVLIERSVQGAREGGVRMEEVSRTYQQSAAIRREALRRSEEIAAACAEQTNGIARIASSVDHMSAIVQRTAAKAEEASAVSRQMEVQAETLRNVVRSLETVMHGQDG